MDRRNRESRQSCLPTSLIPHLYAAPRDSSTRTTLTSHSEDNEQDRSYSFPLVPLVLPLPSPSHPTSSYPNDRQLPPVLPANPIYHSLETSSMSSNLHRSIHSNQSRFYSSLRPTMSSSPTSTLLPPLASLSTDIFPPNPSWREGEAGPSSLVHPAQRDYASPQNRRSSSQPARVITHSHTAFGHRELPRQDAGYYSSFSSPNQCVYIFFHSCTYILMEF